MPPPHFLAAFFGRISHNWGSRATSPTVKLASPHYAQKQKFYKGLYSTSPSFTPFHGNPRKTPLAEFLTFRQ